LVLPVEEVNVMVEKGSDAMTEEGADTIIGERILSYFLVLDVLVSPFFNLKKKYVQKKCKYASTYILNFVISPLRPT
jgi:hypothetical protein